MDLIIQKANDDLNNNLSVFPNNCRVENTPSFNFIV